MSDIVERLRQDIGPTMKEVAVPAYLILEAADEIERLRAREAGLADQLARALWQDR